jgi:hypothetical protein
MKESHSEGLAIHTGLESCGVVRENNVEALTEEGAGRGRYGDIIPIPKLQHRLRPLPLQVRPVWGAQLRFDYQVPSIPCQPPSV